MALHQRATSLELGEVLSASAHALMWVQARLRVRWGSQACLHQRQHLAELEALSQQDGVLQSKVVVVNGGDQALLKIHSVISATT